MSTSNFKSLGSLPLYVFHTEGEVYERAEDEVKKLNIRDFDTYEDFEDAREEEIEKVRDELDSTGVVLTDFDIGELDMEVKELNDDIKALIENDYSYDYTDEEVRLEDIATFDISYGYYEGGQITNKNPETFDDLNDEHQEFILDHLKEIAEKFDLTELRTGGRFDNGETLYSVKKEGKEVKKCEGKEMNEALSDDEMKKEYIDALSKRLDIPSENMTATIERDNIDDGYCTIKVEDDDSEYIVSEYGTAKELAIEQVEDDFEERGLEAFSKDFADYICRNLYDDSKLDDIVKGLLKSEVEDLEDEDPDDNRFENKLEEECYVHHVIDDEDYEENEDGEFVLKDEVRAKLPELKSELINNLFYEIDNNYEYLCDIFGEDEAHKILKEYEEFDEYAIAKEAVEADGVESFLAIYDGKELDLDGDLVAYRIN